MGTNKAVQILLSTYNGECYLQPQLDSLLHQTHSSTSILIRDDGSQDSTVEILQRYADKYPNIRVLIEENVGIVRSYFRLIRLADDSSQYFAFCDQDDVWKDEKVEQAVFQISQHPETTPVVFASRTMLINENEQVLGLTPIPHKPLGLHHALVQNRLIGCTMVFNAAARHLVLSCLPDYQQVALHDWWVYLVVGTFGTVIFDPHPLVHYRQHGQNAVGNQSEGLTARLRRFWRNKKSCTHQAQQFRACYYPLMNDQQRNLIDCFLDKRSTFPQRMRYALTGDVYRQSVFDDIMMRLLIVLNRL